MCTARRIGLDRQICVAPACPFESCARAAQRIAANGDSRRLDRQRQGQPWPAGPIDPLSDERAETGLRLTIEKAINIDLSGLQVDPHTMRRVEIDPRRA